MLCQSDVVPPRPSQIFFERSLASSEIDKSWRPSRNAFARPTATKPAREDGSTMNCELMAARNAVR